MSSNLFFIGITGYLGGTIFSQVDPKQRNISALVRSPEKAEWLRAHNIMPIMGDLDSFDLIEQESSKSDVVINTADSDHLQSVKAVVQGLRKRFQETKKKPCLLHTSGTGCLIDTTDGSPSDVIFRDTDTAALDAILSTALHRHVDTWLFSNSESIELGLVCPPAIYGPATGPPELSNLVSGQTSFMIGNTIRNKKAHRVGSGKSIWSHVHASDLARFYLRLVKLYDAGKKFPQGYFFPEDGEHVMGDLINATASIMKNRGIIDTDEVVEVLPRDEELLKIFRNTAAKIMLGSNSRVRGVKARGIGWKPQESDEILSTLPDDVEKVYRSIQGGTYKWFGSNRSEKRYVAVE